MIDFVELEILFKLNSTHVYPIRSSCVLSVKIEREKFKFTNLKNKICGRMLFTLKSLFRDCIKLLAVMEWRREYEGKIRAYVREKYRSLFDAPRYGGTNAPTKMAFVIPRDRFTRRRPHCRSVEEQCRWHPRLFNYVYNCCRHSGTTSGARFTSSSCAGDLLDGK